MKSQRETELLQEIKALQATLSSQQALFDAIPDIVMEVDAGKVYTWANQAGFEFFGKDVIGKQASHYFEGEQDTYERVQPLFEGDENVIYLESWQRRRDGQKRLLAWWCRVTKDIQGNVTGAISTARDITERVQVMQALRNSEARFRSLLESAPVGIITTDLKGQIETVNSKTEQIFGYNRDELVGQAISFLMPERYGHVHGDHIAKYLSRPEPRAMGDHREIFGLRQDGSEIPLEIGLSYIETKDGLLGVSFISDITERVQAEEEINNLARFPLENPNPVLRVTNEGQLIYANPPSRCLQELWDCEIGDALPDDWKLLISESVASGSGQVKDVQCNGQVFSIMVAPVRGTRYVNLYASDVTKRRLVEKEIKRSNAELEQFAYVASHDLQEPLRAVAGMVQLLQQRYQGKLDERADEYIQLAVEGSTRMQKLIDDLLAYSRVDRRGSQFVQIEMDKILKSALANLSTTIRESDAVVTYDPLPTLVADPAQLTRVFQNLIGNGIKFRGERPPEVHISAQELDNAWRFEVRDNGIGIEPQYHERIFLIFQRLHGRSEYPGTGIGLALCQKIVENHGGRIWIESEAGQGSRFYFTIPHRS